MCSSDLARITLSALSVNSKWGESNSLRKEPNEPLPIIVSFTDRDYHRKSKKSRRIIKMAVSVGFEPTGRHLTDLQFSKLAP